MWLLVWTDWNGNDHWTPYRIRAEAVDKMTRLVDEDDAQSAHVCGISESTDYVSPETRGGID